MREEEKEEEDRKIQPIQRGAWIEWSADFLNFEATGTEVH